MKQIVKDILALKTAHGFIEANPSPEKIQKWYSWLFENGHCLAEYEGRELVGYVEWIFMNDIPKTAKGLEYNVDWKAARCAPVLYIMNMITTRPGLIRKMIAKMRDKIGMEWTYMVWHNERKDKMTVITRGQ